MFRIRVLTRFSKKEDFRSVTDWISSSGLDNPKILVIAEDGAVTVEKLDEKEIKTLNLLVKDRADEVMSSTSRIKKEFGKAVEDAKELVIDEKQLISETSTWRFLDIAEKYGVKIGRGVGGDQAQNSLALMTARTHKSAVGANILDVRMDQGLLKRIGDTLRYVGKKRPDVQIFTKGKADENSIPSHYIGGTSYEFDRPPSRRDVSHAQHFLEANNDGAVVLFEMETTKMAPSSLSALKEFLVEQDPL